MKQFLLAFLCVVCWLSADDVTPQDCGCKRKKDVVDDDDVDEEEEAAQLVNCLSILRQIFSAT